MAGREHEAVAIRPVRALGIELQKLREQNRRHVGHAHRHAGMSAIGLFHSIHRQGTDRVGHVFVVNRNCRAIIRGGAGGRGFHRIVLNLLAGGEDARSTRQNQPRPARLKRTSGNRMPC
jgi:hypothetical protein